MGANDALIESRNSLTPATYMFGPGVFRFARNDVGPLGGTEKADLMVQGGFWHGIQRRRKATRAFYRSLRGCVPVTGRGQFRSTAEHM